MEINRVFTKEREGTVKDIILNGSEKIWRQISRGGTYNISFRNGFKSTVEEMNMMKEKTKHFWIWRYARPRSRNKFKEVWRVEKGGNADKSLRKVI